MPGKSKEFVGKAGTDEASREIEISAGEFGGYFFRRIPRDRDLDSLALVFEENEVFNVKLAVVDKLSKLEKFIGSIVRDKDWQYVGALFEVKRDDTTGPVKSVVCKYNPAEASENTPKDIVDNEENPLYYQDPNGPWLRLPGR